MSENITTQAQTEDNQVEHNIPALLSKIAEYESAFKKVNEKTANLESQLQQKDNELTDFKKRLADLEEQVSDAQKIKAQRVKDNEEVETLKVQSEEILTKAKSMIFDKTKVIKNQELQIEALNQQISSLKDVVTITKDLLDIRNLEVKQLETKIKCMEDKVNAEKERQDLMHKKLETMIRFNGDLKREYETQLCLFSALRERYNERELAKGVLADTQANGSAENNNDSVSPSDTGESSSEPNTSAKEN